MRWEDCSRWSSTRNKPDKPQEGEAHDDALLPFVGSGNTPVGHAAPPVSMSSHPALCTGRFRQAALERNDQGIPWHHEEPFVSLVNWSLSLPREATPDVSMAACSVNQERRASWEAAEVSGDCSAIRSRSSRFLTVESESTLLLWGSKIIWS
jgi:hypothetical protein